MCKHFSVSVCVCGSRPRPRDRSGLSLSVWSGEGFVGHGTSPMSLLEATLDGLGEDRPGLRFGTVDPSGFPRRAPRSGPSSEETTVPWTDPLSLGDTNETSRSFIWRRSGAVGPSSRTSCGTVLRNFFPTRNPEHTAPVPVVDLDEVLETIEGTETTRLANDFRLRYPFYSRRGRAREELNTLVLEP